MNEVQQATVEQEIQQMYGEWSAAIRDGDAGWFRRALVEDFLYIDVLGSVHDREGVIRMDMGVEDEEIRFHELRVRTFAGGFAIVHGHYYARVLAGTGAELSPRLQEMYRRGLTMRFTAVWQKQDGRWRALVHQATEEQE